MNSEENTPLAQLESKIADNWKVFNALIDFSMKKGRLVDLSIGINLGIPFYSCKIMGYRPKIYITKEIRQRIYDYLINGIVPDELFEIKDVYRNVDENFILRCFKEDRENKATTYNAETKEYKAKYKYGTINYGQLPYTTDELLAKLNSLQ